MISKKIFFSIFLSFCVQLAIAQTASQKTINETCACVKKIDASLSDDQKTTQAFTCMGTTFGKYMPDLKKEYNITETDERAAGKAVGQKMAGKIVQDCPEMGVYFMKIAAKSKTNEGDAQISTDTMKLDSKICTKFKTGRYASSKMFMNGKEIENPDKTSETEIKGSFIYDYSNNKTTVTKWALKWINDCEWEQTFEESNDESMKGVFKKGDKIKVKAVGSTKQGNLWISSAIQGMNFIILINKI